MRQQHVGGEQHHFEEDEEVEQVAGEKGAEQAEQLKLKERVEMNSRLVEAGAGIEQDRGSRGGR
jgi:hypothetical protein